MGPAPDAFGYLTSDLLIRAKDKDPADPEVIQEIRYGEEHVLDINPRFDATSALVVYDRYTKWIDYFPQGRKTTE